MDFVVKTGRRVVALEVQSGRTREMPAGMAAFAEAFRPKHTLLVGGDGVSADVFLSRPVRQWCS